VKKIIIGMLIWVVVGAMKPSASVFDYIQSYSGICLQLQDSFQVPASIMLGVAIIESGAGSSKNCKILNNHFGIKAGNKLQNYDGYRSGYKYYETDSLSFIDFCHYLKRRKFYHQLKGNFNYNAWVNAIAKSGYSAKPKQWKIKLNNTIKKYQLTVFDNHVSEKPQ